MHFARSAFGVRCVFVLHEKLARAKRKGEEELLKRLEESAGTAKKDLQLLREILDRI